MPKPKSPAGPPADEHFMSVALREARKAYQAGEVPVGAVVARAGKIIARRHNLVEARQDASQHAEVLALRQAARRLGRWRLTDCSLYVTLEPCAMCAGAAVWSRVGRVVYGAADPKAGACGSVVKVIGNRRLNHRPALTSGVLAEASAKLLQEFFHARRHKR